MKKRKKLINLSIILLYVLFVIVSILIGFQPGKLIGKNFVRFSVSMLKLLPAAFILIGLFQVWVKKETVEKHLGKGSGIKGYIWAILLAGTIIGGIYVALPIAYYLHSKGAKLSVVFTYVGASAICRIPMTIFEISFMGLKFALIRLFVSIPLVIVSSIILGAYLEKKGYNLIKDK